MHPPEFNKIAITAADIVLLNAFADESKFPIDNWAYELTPENIKTLKTIEDHKIAEYALNNLDKLQILIQEAMQRKLDYLFAEGFTRKKKGHYEFYSQKEIDSQIQRILSNDKDSL